MPHDSANANTRQRKELKIIVPSTLPQEDATEVPDTSQSNASSKSSLYIPVHKRPGWKSPYPSEPPLVSSLPHVRKNSPSIVKCVSAEEILPSEPKPLRYSREVLMDSRFHKSSTRTSMKRGVERTCPEILKDNATGGSDNATVQPPVGVGAHPNQPRRDAGRPQRKGRGGANASRGKGRSQRGHHVAKGWSAFKFPPNGRVSRPAQGAV